jgi:FAD/FMN-containing dehydrogenase
MDKAAFLAHWKRFNRIVHDLVHSMNGSIAAEHGVGLIKRDELALYKDPVALDLMHTLKRALDPNAILNPGKVIASGGDLPNALPRGTISMKTIDILAFGEPLMEFAHVERGSEKLYLPGFGGDVSNVAVAAARQGARTAIFTALGDDPFGGDFLKLWDREASTARRCWCARAAVPGSTLSPTARTGMSSPMREQVRRRAR